MDLRGCKRAWNADDVQRDQLLQSATPSKRARRENENSIYLGGMRNPHKALQRMVVLQEAGNDSARLWNGMVKDMPNALYAAKRYGSGNSDWPR